MEADTHPEKDCSALGGLFQVIINDLKGGTPVWEDFLAKASKLHSHLKATVLVSAAFLDSFQKVADMATSTRGATKDVGTALTRLCLRHRSVEAKLKSFTASIMDNLVVPLQDKMEEWKKVTLQLDKDHSKEFKKARQEIKKKSTDTLRLQKKVKKGCKFEMQRSLDSAIQDMSDKYILLEETEKQAVRKALIEERSRFCLFVSCLKPVVEEELTMLHEIAHLQEILDSLAKMTADPQVLPSASEQVITDIKGSDSTWSFQTPPSSPSSLGSRKSSMCSISSLNSSSSGSTKSHSPSHQFRYRSLSQQTQVGALRLSSVSSQDSGFTSQDTLFMRPPSPHAMDRNAQVSGLSEPNNICCANSTSTSSTPSSPYPSNPTNTSTWPNLQDSVEFEKAMASILKCQRPHTISSAYERAGQNRPPLTAETFQPLESELYNSCVHSGSADTLTSASERSMDEVDSKVDASSPLSSPSTPTHSHPPVPKRAVEDIYNKPSLPDKPVAFKPKTNENEIPSAPAVPDFNKPLPYQVIPQPIYVNASDLAKMAAERSESPPLPPPPVMNMVNEEAHDKLNQQRDLAVIMTSSLIAGSCNTLGHKKQPSEGMTDASKICSPNSLSRFEGLSGSSTLPAKSSLKKGSNNHKPPPPPIRRSSSITSQNATTPLQAKLNNQLGSSAMSSPSSMEVLPPPVQDSSEPKSSPGDSEDVSASRARLIQALNARFSNPAPCEQAGLKFSLPSKQLPSKVTEPHIPELPPSPQLSAVDSPLLNSLDAEDHSDDSVSFPQPPPPPLTTQYSYDGSHYARTEPRRPTHPEKKLIRAHTIGYNEREALIQSLNAKFTQQQQGNPPPPPLQPQQLQTTAKLVHRKSSLRESNQNRISLVQEHKTPRTNPKVGRSDYGTLRNRSASVPENQVINTFKANLEQTLQKNAIYGVTMTSNLKKQHSQRNFIDTSHIEGCRSRSPENCSARSRSADPAGGQQNYERFKASIKDDLAFQGDRTERQQFLDALNTRLAEQQGLKMRRGSLQVELETGRKTPSMDGGKSTTYAATRVHNWLASRKSLDLASCRESLMDQIRRGTHLRKVASNDRSTPRIL